MKDQNGSTNRSEQIPKKEERQKENYMHQAAVCAGSVSPIRYLCIVEHAHLCACCAKYESECVVQLKLAELHQSR